MAHIWYDGNLNLVENKRVIGENSYYIRGTQIIDKECYERYAIKTHFINKGEDYIELMKKYVLPLYKKGDIVSISEKVISMCQNRVVDKSEIKIGLVAKILSKFATRTKSGIGMDEPYKLQLVINLKGVMKVLLASLLAGLGKLINKRGIFYQLLGKEVAGIDGFYAHSAFEVYHDLAVLNPLEPEKVCNEIEQKLSIKTMIVDANDIDVDILGKASTISLEESTLKKMIEDNPAGQDDECTPFIIIRKINLSDAETYVPVKPSVHNNPKVGALNPTYAK